MSGPDVLTLAEVCALLRISTKTAMRRMAAGRFPVPCLPRLDREPYGFSAARVQRYIERAEDGVVLSYRSRA